MKANELVVGKEYWCGWASRSAWFVRFETHTWCGKTEKSQSSVTCAIAISNAMLNRWSVGCLKDRRYES